MPVPVPYESFKTANISLTGFREEERDHIDKLVKLLGGNTTDKLTNRNTHLICKEPTGAKYDVVVNKWKCKRCKPVSVEWLYESAKQVIHLLFVIFTVKRDIWYLKMSLSYWKSHLLN